MEITWLGHSSFRLRGSQTVIITDPYSPDLGYTAGKLAARVVTVSHEHTGHNNADAVPDEPYVVRGPGEYEISGVLILGVPAYHDESKGATRGKNTIYVMDIDGISVCHVGDLGHLPNMEQREAIGEVDILMVPVGGVSTIDAAEATELVRQLEPALVLPMHYQTPAITRKLAPVTDFLKEMGAEQTETRPKLTISRSGLPDSPQIVLLDY